MQIVKRRTCFQLFEKYKRPVHLRGCGGRAGAENTRLLLIEIELRDLEKILRGEIPRTQNSLWTVVHVEVYQAYECS
jgi:hypothetical protein